jgi:hypothetical protein
MTIGSATLFDQICDQLREQPDHKGEVWIDCPWCGRKNKHFSFSERGYKCFGCDEKGKSLHRLAEQLQIADRPAPVARRILEPVAPRQWQQRPEFYLDRYGAAFDRLDRWQAYKPLTIDSIARWRLGVGRLPSSRCEHRRLILPVFEAGRVVAFHGRAYLPEDHDAKWLTAGGSSKQVLFNLDLVQVGSTVVIAENFVDAILAMQVEPSIVAVAGGGASWQPHWTEQLAERRPARVVVWLDHDLAGNGSRYHYAELVRVWREKNPQAQHAPEPRGPQIANDLLAAGLRASVYEWPSGTPLKADIGWALMNESAR